MINSFFLFALKIVIKGRTHEEVVERRRKQDAFQNNLSNYLETAQLQPQDECSAQSKVQYGLLSNMVRGFLNFDPESRLSGTSYYQKNLS